MDAGEVVVHEEQGNRGLVVLDLLEERIGKPREMPHGNPHRQVGELDIGRRNMGRFRVSRDTQLLRPRAFCGAGPAFATRCIAVDPNELGEVNVGPEGVCNGLQTGLVA
jgi:hypothetical protein